MKISKAGILTLGVMFLIGSMGLILVNAEEPEDPEETEELEVNIYIDPSNAIQHIQEVHFVSTGGNTRTAKMKRKDNRLVGIETSIDFILSKTGDDINTISSQSGYNSILGGIKNKILGRSKYSVILAGLENIITGKHNTIIGGKNNSILGESSTILGGSSNYVTGNYSVIVGSHNNVTGDYSVVVGLDNTIKGNNSVILGSKTNVEADNSFLLNLKHQNQIFEKIDETNLNNVFMIESDSGVVINSDKAHSFSKLTLGGSLSIFSNSDDENIQCGSGKGGGIIKAVNTNVGQMCLCSCDGSGWNSMLARGTCVGACEQPKKPECGDTVERVCSDEGGFTYLGSCNTGSFPIEGEGSYLVDKYDKVHWSCQTEDGSIVFCSGGISNVVNECAHRCEGNLPNNAIANGRQITDRAGVEYFYDPESTDACSYKCMSGFDYVIEAGERKCIKCKAGTYNTGSHTCIEEAVCIYPKVPYNGGCINLGNCTNKPLDFNISRFEQYRNSSTEVDWYNYREYYFHPYGANTEKKWTCKSNSGDVDPHSCEFSCKSDYECKTSSNGDYCIKKNSYKCEGRREELKENETRKIDYPNWGKQEWHHPTESDQGNGVLSKTPVSSYAELTGKIQSQATGCYYFCDEGYHISNNQCKSNCDSMSLGAKSVWSYDLGKWYDYHLWNSMLGPHLTYTGHFYNGKSARRTGKTSHYDWTYVESGTFDERVKNESGYCLRTCRSGIPIENIQTISTFKEHFRYETHKDYNVCREECANGYYFSGYMCVKVSTNQYIPDNTKTITYLGVTNPIAERKACNEDQNYNNGVCEADWSQQECTTTGYEYVNGHCITCPYGFGFTGDGADIHCVEYDRCDVNHNRLINEKDRDFVSNCINNGGIGCDSQANLNHDGSVNSGDLQYFDDICYKKMCDHNGDGKVDIGDRDVYGETCQGGSVPAWCDLNGDGSYGSGDYAYRRNDGKCVVVANISG